MKCKNCGQSEKSHPYFDEDGEGKMGICEKFIAEDTQLNKGDI